VIRATSARVAAGGKGVNVARALSALGARARCLGPLGGASGRILAELAAGEKLEAVWTWCEIETRTCLILVDSAARQATVVNEAGPRLTSEDWKRVSSDVLRESASSAAICVSGSLPLGVLPEDLAGLCRSLRDAERVPWVDSSGPALAELLSVGGLRLKINRDEAEEALGRFLESIEDCAAAARELVKRGMTTVVLTHGADGAVLATAGGCWQATGPPIESASAVASGDSFLAGLVAALDTGHDLPEALAWGVAAGAANAEAEGGARFTRTQFDSILARVEPRRVSG
jgi:1-phosphofructokinase family hexose kinase